MVIRIDFKKVGNHWYPCLKHDDPNDLCLEPKVERLLSKIDYVGFGSVTMYVKQSHSIIGSKGIVQFTDDSIRRYLQTDESFLMSMYIDDYHYQISTELFTLLENEFGLDLYHNFYQLELW